MSNEVEIVVKTTDKTKTGLDAATKSVGNFKTAAASAAGAAAGMLAGQAIVAGAAKFKTFMNDSVEAASNLGESVNAVQQIFGKSSAEILAWGKNNANSFGLSQRAFNEMSGPLGAGLKNAGLSMQDTTKWTIDLTKRASDMASVFNTTVPDALEAIQAGLRGESDPLEKYGVGLSAAKVQAQALTDTHKTLASELTSSELATGRLNLIMKQTSATAGDFQRTSGGLANAQRIADAQMEDAKAKLGQGLIPAYTLAAKATSAFATGLAALPAPLQTTVVAIAALGTAAVLLGPRIGAGVEHLRKLGNGALAAETRLGSLTRTAGKVGGALAAIQVASAFMDNNSNAKGIETTTLALEKFAKTGDTSGDTLGRLSKDLGTLGMTGRGAVSLFDTMTGYNKVFADGLGNTDERIAAIDGAMANLVSSGNSAKARDIWQALAVEATKAGSSAGDLYAAMPQYQNALDGVTRSTAKTTDATKTLTKTTAQLREEATKTAAALLDERGAHRDLEQAIDDATEARKKNGRTMDINTQKGRDNQAALDGIASAARKEADAILATTGSQAKANASIALARPRLEAAARAFGMTKAEAHKYAAEILGIPTVVTTTLNFNAGTALLAAQRAKNKLAAMDRATGYAHGGIVSARVGGGPGIGDTLVGENGPELVHLPPGSKVHSAPDTQRILNPMHRYVPPKTNNGGTTASTSAGTDYTAAAPTKVILELKSSGTKIDDMLLEILRHAIRVRGGNVQTVLGAKA